MKIIKTRESYWAIALFFFFKPSRAASSNDDLPQKETTTARDNHALQSVGR